MAPQHRRGGKHAVKDEDLTHTKYDDYNREQLLAAVKEAGCYVKDDKKSVMARKLAEHDRNKQHEQRRALQEQTEREEAKQRELANAAQARRHRRAARAKRNESRSLRYERGEEVSSNSSDTASDQSRCAAHKLTVTGGEAFSDETWEDSCSETTIRTENPPIHPACRLRLLEWPYPDPPPSIPPSALQPELHPAPLPYAPLKLATTTSNEKLTLPGKNYPAGVDPDYVPTLDALTRTAARHGHLLNQLSRAVIEPASLWAARTTVQPWNGALYFALPAPSHHDIKTTSALDEVYRKWHAANAKLLHPKPGATDVNADRQARFKQRASNKRRRVAEVYEASLWKPTRVGYVPAYLDWEAGGAAHASVRDCEKAIGSLWYVRFPGCDVPHYYFWSAAGGWRNPSVPHSDWSVERFLSCKKVRVKKLMAAPKARDQRFGEQLQACEDTRGFVEQSLVQHGLRATIKRCQAHARAAGKAQAWTAFTRPLLEIYPSGAVPRAPPVHPSRDACLATKIALLLDGHDVEPYTGEESWTRNDDAFWDVVSDGEHNNGGGVYGSGLTEKLESMASDPSMADGKRDAGPAALYRRDSMQILPSRTSTFDEEDEEERVWTWLHSIDATFPPPSTPLLADVIGLDEPTSPLKLSGPETMPTCPFCSFSWLPMPEWEKAAHMLSHSRISSQPQTSTYTTHVSGQGVKRRHSVLSQRTLQTYHRKYGGGAKMARVDSARSLAGSLAESLRDRVVDPIVVEVQKATREMSPFSKERAKARARVMQGLQVRCGQGRGGRGWMLERAWSEHGEGGEMDVDDCEGESVWFGDDEM